MFEALIEKLILSYFGDYIENLDRNKLSLGLWSGSLTLEDIKINPKSINKFKLPFKFLFGRIKKLTLLIPWKENFSVPTEITIESIQIVLTATSDNDKWEYTDYNNYENKLYYLLKFSKERMLQLTQSFIAESNKNEDGNNNNSQNQNNFWDGIFVKILDNLQVKFKNVHIRIEVPFNNNHTSLGISLQEMFVVNTNEEWKEEFIDRNVNKNVNIFKLLKISNFGIYLNPNESFFLYNIYNENFNIKDENEVQGIIEENMTNIFPEEEQKLLDTEYLIEPMSLTAKMTQRNDITIKESKESNINNKLPRIHLILELNKFNFDIQKEQYDCIIRIMNTINQYHQILYDFNNTTKFKFFRPNIKLSAALKEEDKETKKKIIRKWWKYAINMIIGQIKYFKNNDKNVFNLPPLLIEEYKKDFEILFKKYYLLKSDNNSKKEELNEKELKQLYKILEITDLKDLYVWSRPVLQNIFTERKKEEKKYNNSTYIGLILGSNFNEDELITKEEQDKISEILTNEINKVMKLIINNDLETKLQIDFILNEGSFKFTKFFNEQKITEGFEFQYKGFYFSTKKGEHFNEFNLRLEKINVYLFNIVNNNIVSIPITYKFLEQGGRAGQTKFIKKNNKNENNPIIKRIKINKKKNSNNSIINSTNVSNNNTSSDSDSISYNYETFNSVHSDFDESEKEDFSIQKYHKKLSSFKIEEFEENQESEYSDADEIKDKEKYIDKFNENFIDKNKYFMTLFFRKNLYNTEDNINSKLNLYINSLHITYHQVFLERIIKFFKVQLDEDLANKAFDKFLEIQLGTKKIINANIYKKNIIQICIEPRKILIPINKYDIKNSKILLLDLGRIDSNDNKMIPESIDYSNYKEKYSLYFHSIGVNYYTNYEEMIKDEKKFEIISKLSLDLTFGFLNPGLSDQEFPLYKFFMNINSMNIDLNCYIYTIFIAILNILKPTKEIDLWSQLNTSKKQIKTNSKVAGFILKKSIYKKYQQYYAVLSGGYIYFYYDNIVDDYFAYFHLKNCDFNELEEDFSFKLSSNYGSIELKLFDKKSYDSWKKNIIDRITEMKISYKFQEDEKLNQENMQLMKENPKQIFFGAEINFKEVNVRLHKEENNNKNIIFIIINLSNLKALLSLRLFDSELHMDIQSITVYDNLTQIKDFQTILTTEKKNAKNNKKILDLNILLCEEKSDRYKNIQIDVNMIIGVCTILWNPSVIKNIISFVIYNDIYKFKVKQELTNQNMNMSNKDFIIPGTVEINRPKCNINKYTYMNIHSSFNEISIILIQPIYQIKFSELRFGSSFLDYQLKVDHSIIKGELGNTQLFDLCQYPFVIKNQKEFDQSKIKEIFGIKKNNNDDKNDNNSDSSLIKFYYKAMNPWCPECKDNYTSEADIIINQSMLIFIYEQFMRFFNYFISQFLGAFSSPEKVKKFKQSISNIKPKKDKDIDFMKLKVVINSPQIILKPRYYMDEYFLIDLGDINLSLFYQKIYGKVRNDINDYRWLSTYQINMKNFAIKTHDNFHILNNSNIIANMHFVNATEQDKLMSEIDFDFSYQFDLIIDNLDMNMRQKDLTNLLRCIDLNILYTDNQSKFYDYENYYKVKRRKTLEKRISFISEEERESSDSEESSDENYRTPSKNIDINQVKESLNSSKKKDLLNKYYRMICYLLIKKISIKLYLIDDIINNKSEIYNPFVELILKETQTIFTKKLDNSNETRIVTADMELFEIPFIRRNYSKIENNINDYSKFKILSEFTQNLITGESEDYENNNYKSFDEQKNYIKRKTLRKSTILEEKIFKLSFDEDDKNNEIEEKENLFLKKSKLKQSRKKIINFISDKDICNSIYSETNNNEMYKSMDSNSKFIRNKNKKSTIKMTVNDNIIYNESNSESFMNQTYTLIKKCVIIPFNEMLDKSTKIQTDIIIQINPNREKSFQLTLNGFKLIMRIDIFQLCRYFFLESFPFYDKTSKDLPNLFDPDEDNKPGMKIYIKLKHPIICFLTDDITNKDQELICITSEVSFGIKNDKMSIMKKELIKKYNELFNKLKELSDLTEKNNIENELKKLHSVNNIIKCTMFDICPFICEYKNLDNKNNENLFVNKRKIMNDFDFSYVSEYIINYLPEENKFKFENLQDIKFTNINVKASYRDIVLYLKLYNYFYSLYTEEYYKKTDSLMHYTHQKELYEQKEAQEHEEKKRNSCINNDSQKDIININQVNSINNFKTSFRNNNIYGKNQIKFLLDGLKLILIDDHSNTFYPFLDFSIENLELNNISNNNIKKINSCKDINNNINRNNTIENNNIEILNELKGEIFFKILTYNYIAGEWEPLLEKSEIEFVSKKKSEKINFIQIITKTKENDNKTPDININISDLTIIFLYTTFNKWYDKFNALQKDYSEIKKYKYLKNISIINHTVYNYSGRELNFYQKTCDYKSILNSIGNEKLKNIKPDNSYDIEIDNNDFFLDKKKIKQYTSNYIKLYVENAHVSNHIIQIDNLQKKYHRVNYNEVNSLKDYLVNLEDKNLFNKYCFLISKIELHGLKKIIYFYSPLAFHNKTNFNFEIKINNHLNIQKIYQLSPKKTIGIPFEFLNGNMEIKLEGSTEIKKFSIYKDFLLPEIFVESDLEKTNKLNNEDLDENELNHNFSRKKFKNKNMLKELCFISQFNQTSYINLTFNNPQDNKYFTEFEYSSNTTIDKLNRIVNLCISYTLLSCLPFDVKIIFNDEFTYDNIHKNQKISLTNISVFSPLKMKLFIKEYSTKKSVIIYDIYKGKENNTTIPIKLYSDDASDKSEIVIQVTINKKLIILHANSILVNHTDLNLEFKCGYKENEINSIVANQKEKINYYILNDEQFLQISHEKKNLNKKVDNNENKKNIYISEPISITALTRNLVIELKNASDKTQIELIMEISLSLLNIKFDLYCKIIKIAPRYILYNQLKIFDLDIYLDNIDSDNHLFLCNLKKGQKHPVYYSKIKERDIVSWELNETTHEQKKSGKKNIIRFIPHLRDDNNINGQEMIEKENNKDEDYYSYSVSSPYSTEGDSLVTLACAKKDKNKNIIDTSSTNEDIFYFNIEKRNYDLSTYLIIREANNDYSQIFISNNTNNIKANVWQQNYQDKKKVLEPNKSSIFVWKDPTKKQIINFKFYLINIRNIPDNLYKFELYKNKIRILNDDNEKENNKYLYSFEEEIKIYLNDNNKKNYYVFHLSINFNGNKIIIELKNINTENEIILAKNSSLLNKTKYEFKIKKLGISIIGDNKHLIKNSSLNKKYERNEICYMTLQEISIEYKKEQTDDSNDFNDFIIKIKDIEIDNELSYITNYPIIWLPVHSYRRKDLKKKLNNEINDNENNFKDEPFFVCSVKMNKRKGEKITRINYFKYEIKPFDLNIESSIFLSFFNLLNNLSNGMSTSITYINPLFQENKFLEKNNIKIINFYYEPSFLREKIPELEGEEENKNIIFINELIASSLEFNLTFIAQIKDQMFEKILQPNVFLRSLLNILNKTENVPFELKGGITLNLIGNLKEIFFNLLEIYKQQILIQFVNLFGGMEILGNPINLLNNIGKGFQDLLTKPGEGLMQGPIEGVKGLADGATSLVKHTVNGTFNSTSKIASGISQGILFLTQDDDYINEREQKKITEKPKDIMEGIGYGLSSVVGGVFYGLSDIILKPIQETKKEGIVNGLTKGVLKGLGGAIIKPISGVFDFVSKTTEGIKNGVNDDRIINRIREPRVFYGIFKVIKEYRYKDAYLKKFLYNDIQEIKENYDFVFYDFVMYNNKKEEPIILVFVQNGFWIIDILRKDLKSIVSYSDIKNVELIKKDVIRIFFNKPINNEKFCNIKLSNETKHPEKIVDKLKNAINSHNWKRNMK